MIIFWDISPYQPWDEIWKEKTLEIFTNHLHGFICVQQSIIVEWWRWSEMSEVVPLFHDSWSCLDFLEWVGRRFGWYLLNHLAASWDHYRHPKIGRRHILMQDALVWQLCFLSMQPIDWFAESVFWLLMSNGKDLYGHTPLALATESGHEKVVEAGQLGIRVGSSLTWPGFEVMNEALASKGEDEPAPADEAWVWRRMHWYGWVSKLL